MTNDDRFRLPLNPTPNTMIVHSPFPDVTIPDVPLAQFVLQLAQELATSRLIEGQRAASLPTPN